MFTTPIIFLSKAKSHHIPHPEICRNYNRSTPSRFVFMDTNSDGKRKKYIYKQVKQENRSLSHLCRTRRCTHSQWSACFYSRCYGNGCLKRSLHLCYARNGGGREGSQITITIPWYILVYIYIYIIYRKIDMQIYITQHAMEYKTCFACPFLMHIRSL